MQCVAQDQLNFQGYPIHSFLKALEKRVKMAIYILHLEPSTAFQVTSLSQILLSLKKQTV